MKKKPPFINIVIASLLALSTALIGLLSGFAPNEPFPAVTPYLRYTWPLLGIVTLAFISLTIWQTVRQSANDDDKPMPRSEHRRHMLAKVRAFWIKGVLEQSLHGAALIALGLHEQPDAVENPWRLVLQLPDQSAHPLPPGTRITQVFDDAGGELLILGEPGSGKTTLLLELARDLLERAQEYDNHLIPVVFNLSSWTVKRQSIAEWLVEELNTKYQVPRKIGQSWIAADQVLPLFDGLDEVAKEYRSERVGAINTYRRKHMVPIVVCSRSAEYFSQTSRVQVRRAVAVQPLTTQQIDDYLASAGGKLATVRVALRKDKELEELATTPLMLSILTLAYHGMAVEDILADRTPEPRRRQVFEVYVRHMLERRGTGVRYTPQQTIYWLTWLAHQMQRQHLTEFYLERLQPTWLPTKRSQTLYQVFNGLAFLGLATGLFGILLGDLLSRLNVGLSVGLLGELFFVLVGMLVGGLLGKAVKTDLGIRPAEILKWSWKNAKPWLVIGPTFGLAIGLLGALAFRLPGGLVGGLAFALVLTLALVLVGGLSGEQINGDTRIHPNQGIRSSGRIALFTGLVCVLVGAPGVGLIAGPVGGLIGGLSFGLLGGLVFGALQPHLFSMRWRQERRILSSI